MDRNAIYSSYSSTQKTSILYIGAFISILTPFTNTICLPALFDIQMDLSTTDSMVSLSVAIHLAAVGLGQLVWGPLSDQYGRLPILVSCLTIYEIISISIIFAHNISVLILERFIQGFVVGSAILSVQGTLVTSLVGLRTIDSLILVSVFSFYSFHIYFFLFQYIVMNIQ